MHLNKTQLAAFIACAVFAAGALAKAPADDTKKLGMTGTEQIGRAHV